MMCWQLSCLCKCDKEHQQCRIRHSDLPDVVTEGAIND